MYVYIKDIVASHIDTVDIKENTYIKGHSGFILKVYSHEHQHLCLCVRLCQDDNIVSMRMLCQTQRMGVEPILCV